MYLAQGHNTATCVRIEPRPLALESDALELDLRASLMDYFISDRRPEIVNNLKNSTNANQKQFDQCF